MSLLTLSKRQEDLLVKPEKQEETFKAQHEDLATVRKLEAPKNASTAAPHELMAEGSRMNTKISSLVNARRMIGGNGQAEQFIVELNSAANINRGPDGVFDSSRLHYDMLLGRDSRIYPSDYLNFDAKYKC